MIDPQSIQDWAPWLVAIQLVLLLLTLIAAGVYLYQQRKGGKPDDRA